MESDDSKNELQTSTSDYVASAAKSALGAVPFIGSLLSELAGTIIPNQRIERIVKFAEKLELKISQLEQEFVKSQFKNEEFNDLIEEGLRQSTRSLSDERRDYIVSLISNSLSSEDIEYQESKHLLRILGELTDIEVIWLRFYLVSTIGGDEEFREKHKELLQPISRSMGAPTAVLDKGALQDSYKEHLCQLGLLEKVYGSQLDSKRGGLKIKSYNITPFGRLLLREIGLNRET